MTVLFLKPAEKENLTWTEQCTGRCGLSINMAFMLYIVDNCSYDAMFLASISAIVLY